MNDRIDELIALAALGELTAHEAAELDAAVAADPARRRRTGRRADGAARCSRRPVRATARAQGVGAGGDLEPATRCGVDDGPSVASGRRRKLTGSPHRSGRSGHASTCHSEHGHADRCTVERGAGSLVLAAAAVLAIVVGGVMHRLERLAADEDPIAAVVDADDAGGSVGDGFDR